ncbi:MAG: ABC transporter ATP-binding protein [Methylococcaceae bacterium]
MSKPPAIIIEHLSKSYRESDQQHEILDKIDLTIQPGEFIVLLGRSGSGKSTLLNLISGIDLPSSGNITINEIQLTQLSEHERTLFRRHHIGFIYQSYNLIATLNVLENLLLPLELIQRTSQEDRQQAIALLSSLDLANRLDTFPDRLSGGEQQRVSIARALIHDPELILADEPTGNLDLETGQQVLEILDKLVRKAGKTLIMATHSQEVIGLADRVLTVKNKHLVTVK